MPSSHLILCRPLLLLLPIPPSIRVFSNESTLRMRWPKYWSFMPPQLEKNHVVPTAWQDEALARDGVSREVPCSALKGAQELWFKGLVAPQYVESSWTRD